MHIVKKADEKIKPDTWKKTVDSDTGKKTVWFRCPNGHMGTLDDHIISYDGTVTPSVVCPEEGCKFHENIKLDAW